MKRFKMTEDHIKLIRNMYVDWCSRETGAPCIDPKRPYGNSCVNNDIGHILEVERAYQDLEEPRYSLTQEAGFEKLHKETETALQIILRTGKFEAGIYVCQEYSTQWEMEQ